MEMEPSRFASYRRIVARGRHITLTKKLLAEQMLDAAALRELLAKKW